MVCCAQDALIDGGVAIDPQLVQQPLSSGYPNKGYREMKALLALETPPTAVFAVSDRTALGAIRALREAGLQVPGDFSVVGFDDMPPNAYPPPALSTVTSERIAMGCIAMQRLHRIIKNPRYVPIQIVMPCELVIRESSALPRKRN
ncbi:MAG: substrate-binding domain-containing protein [Chloroflexi bacterium]|nr:substrate-binding domain-containing protein [Chloroflexota bacterium]MCY3582158.1 substrate-binding domain-containing protein [Chloroflexota bacterium]MCY3715151.1 substrate-binding domain-containing protein [Chloroflexota bacterium]MDE2649922.1 substrate-binding domain-containing protein [Chloroflexota bacterium]MXV94150.1 substrate-binding domain-containing protein [Chloroflexota bacterium]